MKLTGFFIAISVFSALAGTSYSQTKLLNLDLEKTTVKEVLSKIEDQSEFYFMYSGKVIDVDREVSVNIKNQNIEKALNTLFAGTNVTYVVKDRFIVLTDSKIGEDVIEMLQQKSVSGTVTDESGLPLPGVTVVVKGTTQGTVTNPDGRYLLSGIPETATLVFSFVGMLTQEIPVGDQTTLNVTMVMDAIGIEEVVAIGFGTQKRKDVTGAITSVTGETLNEIPVPTLEQSLSGRAAGVQVTQGSGVPGAGASIRIRGVGTVNNAEPLYVIDGIIIGNITGGGQTSISPLSMINPNDIESIDILKDASATAIYGARAGNGVVIITTKKGKAGVMNIAFHAYTAVSNLQKDKVEMLSGPQWAEYYDNLMTISNRTDYPGKAFVQSVRSGGDYDTWDWTDYAIRTGQVQNYDLSLNSGSEKSQIYASLNYYDQTGIMINSDLKRYNLRLNSDHKINEKLKFGQTLTISRTSNNTVGNLNANDNTRDWMRRLLLMNPYKPPYKESGGYAGTSDFYDPQLDHDNYHALWALEQLYNHTDNTRLLSSVYGEWEFMKDLTFRTSLSIDWSTAKGEQRSPNMLIEGNATNDRAANSLSLNQSDNQTWLIENTLNYNKTFKDHTVTALAGYQAQHGIFKGFSAGDSYFVDSEYWFFSRPVLMKDIKDSQGNIVTTIPQTLPTVGNYQSESSVVSWFGRLFYSYKDRYLVTATLRHDASSKFGSNKRWGNFPAVNMGWRVTEEDFMADQKLFSNLKLRMGYGISGSDNVPNYQFQSTVSGGADYNYVFNEGRVEGYTLNRLANPFLQWENIKMANIGIDAGFFDNRLSVVIDAYQKNTEKLFLTFAPPMEVGLESSPNGNLGEVQNSGLELDINGNILNGPFTWNSNINFSTVKNKVISLAADGADRYNGVNITRVGEEIGAIYGYVHDGLFQNWDEVYSHAYQKQVTTGAVDANGRPVYDTAKRDVATGLNFTAPGDIRFKDLNGDGVIEGENDRAIIGSTIPDFIWGWNNEVSYQGFSLSVFFQGVHGIDLYNTLKAGQERTDLGFGNKRATVLDAWSGEGSENFYHRQSLTDPNLNFRTSSRYIEDGSYIRLKNVRLTYDLPGAVLSAIGIKNAQVYVNATNLLTFTKYTGFDPEIGLRDSGSPETAGVDAGVYPVTTMFTGGFKVTF